MLPFVLYFVTALATGIHLFALLGSAASSGNMLVVLGLTGSAGLSIAAVMALFHPRIAARVALLAALIAWCFYGPAIAALARAGAFTSASLRLAWLPLLALVLLACASLYAAIVSFQGTGDSGQENWLSPRAPSKTVSLVTLAVSAVLLLATVWLFFGVPAAPRGSERILVPGGYVGWVRVDYRISGEAALPLDHGTAVVRIPPDGKLRTSSSAPNNGRPEIYYDDPQGPKPLPLGGSGQMIWGRMNGESAGVDGVRQYEQFFVGTREQFLDRAGDGRPTE